MRPAQLPLVFPPSVIEGRKGIHPGKAWDVRPVSFYICCLSSVDGQPLHQPHTPYSMRREACSPGGTGVDPTAGECLLTVGRLTGWQAHRLAGSQAGRLTAHKFNSTLSLASHREWLLWVFSLPFPASPLGCCWHRHQSFPPLLPSPTLDWPTAIQACHVPLIPQADKLSLCGRAIVHQE